MNSCFLIHIEIDIKIDIDVCVCTERCATVSYLEKGKSKQNWYTISHLSVWRNFKSMTTPSVGEAMEKHVFPNSVYFLALLGLEMMPSL